MLILDINGYLVTPSAQTYQFYPLTLCRIVDTRTLKDGGTLQAGVDRDYPIAGNCDVPPEAIAYSFNVNRVANARQPGLSDALAARLRPCRPRLHSERQHGNRGCERSYRARRFQPATAFYAHNLDTDLPVDIDGYLRRQEPAACRCIR